MQRPPIDKGDPSLSPVFDIFRMTVLSLTSQHLYLIRHRVPFTGAKMDKTVATAPVLVLDFINMPEDSSIDHDFMVLTMLIINASR